MSTTEASEVEAVMLGDFRPGYTLWKKIVSNVVVIVVQGEGGDLIAQDVEDGFLIMKKVIRESKRYATFYDLTDGMNNLWPQAPALLRFASEMREDAADRQICTIAVCPHEKVRNWVRWILGVASKGTAYYITKTTSEAWKYLDSDMSTTPSDDFGECATLPQTLMSDAVDPLLDPVRLLSEPSLLRLL